jgi:thiamine biosynthesis lipoprotein
MTERQIKILTGFTCVVVLAAVGYWAWAERQDREVQVDSGFRVVMSTLTRIVAIAPDRPTATKAIEAAFKDQQWIERTMSYHTSDSELAKVNAEAYDHPVQISAPLWTVLEKAVAVSRLSEGTFDITVGPLMDLWKAASQAGVSPTDAELNQARAKVGWEKVLLDPNQRAIRFSLQGMRLDLGGIAKGYAVDRSVQILREQGATGGMVDLGGNIRCFGRPPKGKDCWKVGIQDPCQTEDLANQGEGVVMVLKLTDQAVATSGHYRRYVMVGDRKVSHILDPRTGLSNEQVASVTILAPDAMTADAMTKPVCLLPEDKAKALIEGQPNLEAIVMAPDRSRPGGESLPLRIWKTRGADRYIMAP